MNRRKFLTILGAAGIGWAGGKSIAGWLQPWPVLPRPQAKYWLWMHPNQSMSDAAWQKRFAQIRAAGIEALLFLAYGGIQAFYPSKHLPVAQTVLEQILPLARKEGLQIHAWIYTLMCNQHTIRASHPDWFVVNRKGESCLEKPPYVGYYNWLCPSRPEVRDHVAATVTELANIPGLDGVHLDYIRFPDVILPRALQPKYHLVQDRELPEFDYCYCDICRQAFHKESGQDPLQLPDPALNSAWREFRQRQITRLVAQLAAIVRARGKCCSAAVFATPTLARQYVRQAWDQWDLDCVFPMIYHNFYAESRSWIQTATREGVVALTGSKPLYTGLFIPALTPSELSLALTDVDLGGAAGAALFSFESMKSDHWLQLQNKKSGEKSGRMRSE